MKKNPIPFQYDNILFTGFRATGKSLVGSLLARKLGYTFVDADIALCEQQGMSVRALVEQYGWQKFRALEYAFLEGMLTAEQTVLAVGGGAIEHTTLWPDLEKRYYIVWLRASQETICTRMGADHKNRDQRPALLGTHLEEEVRQMLVQRTPLYAAGAHYIVDTDDLDPEAVVSTVLQQCSRVLQSAGS